MSGRQVSSSAHKGALFTKLTNPNPAAASKGKTFLSGGVRGKDPRIPSFIANDDFFAEHCQVNKAGTPDLPRPSLFARDQMMPRSARWDVHGSLDYLLSDTMRSVGSGEGGGGRGQNSRCYMKGPTDRQRTGGIGGKELLDGEGGGFDSVVR